MASPEWSGPVGLEQMGQGFCPQAEERPAQEGASYPSLGGEGERRGEQGPEGMLHRGLTSWKGLALRPRRFFVLRAWELKFCSTTLKF